MYEYLVDPRLLVEWIAVEAEATPTVGGMIRWRHANGDTVQGRFLELDAPKRVVFTYGWEGGVNGLAPGASTVEVTLEDLGARTRLRLRQSMLPPETVEAHRYGWEHFLRELARVITLPVGDER